MDETNSTEEIPVKMRPAVADAKTALKFVGVSSMVYGVFQLVACGWALAIFVSQGEYPMTTLYALAAVCLLGFGNVWVGAHIRRRHRGIRPLATALSVVNLLQIPFGTILGVVVLKRLWQQESQWSLQ